VLHGRTMVDEDGGDGVEWVLMVVFDFKERRDGVFRVQGAERRERMR